MIILILPALLAVVSSVVADVTFTVIGFPSAADNTFSVEINKKLYPLTTSKNTFPLWSASVPVSGTSGPVNYRYVQVNKGVAGTGEKFQRRLTSAKATLNEFYDRQTTVSNLPSLKQIYKDIRPKASKAIDDSQVATIHITVDQAALDDMLKNPLDRKRKAIPAGLKFINSNTVYSVDAVKFKVSGRATRKNNKVSLGIKFDVGNGDTFFNRPIIKLRAQRNDPTMIREKLYTDILVSVGVASYQGSYVRVYANGKALGLFLMVEDIENPFMLNTIHRGEIQDVAALGSLWKINSGKTGTGREAALRYQGPYTKIYDDTLYKNEILGKNPEKEPMQQLIALMKDLQDWSPASAGGIAFWSKRLDLDGYLRSMAVEYLAGATDAFWWRANNYFMYFNPQTNVWQFLPTDFDYTFGNGNRPETFTKYRDFGQRLPNGKRPYYPLVDKLIYENKEINQKFENILITITKGVFNSAVLNARIDAYVKQIEADVVWDYEIDRSNRPGRDRGWTKADFYKSLDAHVKSTYQGLKPWIKGRAETVTKQLGTSA